MSKKTVATALPWQAVLLCCAAVSRFDRSETPHDVGSEIINNHLVDANGDGWAVAVVSDETGLRLRLCRYRQVYRNQLNAETCVELTFDEVKRWHVSLELLSGDGATLPESAVLADYAKRLAKATDAAGLTAKETEKFQAAVKVGQEQKAEIKELTAQLRRQAGDLDKALKKVASLEEKLKEKAAKK